MSDSQTLGDNNVANAATLSLNGGSTSGEDGMHIFVQEPDGDSIKLEVELSNTVAEIKTKVEEKSGIKAAD